MQYISFDGAALPRSVGLDGAGGARVSDGKPGHLCFGPYASLGPGHYVAGYYMRSLAGSGAGQVNFDVVIAGGSSLVERSVEVSDLFDDTLLLIAMEFEIAAKTDALEVRAFVPSGVLVEIAKLVIFSRRTLNWGGS